MPVLDASKHRRVEAPVVANAGRGSKRKAPVAPGPREDSRTTKLLNPQDFVCVQALPGFAPREGKVLARSNTIYKSSELPREQVFWETYHRRQKQFTQGHFTPIGKPYEEIGDILYTDPKKLTLYSLGQLAQEPVKKEELEKTPKEVAELTTDKDSFNPEFDRFQSDPLEPVKRLSPFRKKGKTLRTVSKTLVHSRHHVSSVKQGGEYFHRLHQESLERKHTLKAAQQAEGTRRRPEFQPPKYSSDEEETEEENISKKTSMTLRSFTPVYTSVLISNPPGAKSKTLFRQLCVIHWLLEALTLYSSSLMCSILTCWNPRDPGGCKKTAKEITEERLATYVWKLFITKTKKWKARYRALSRKISKIPALHISQLSGRSSTCGQTPRGSEVSTVFCSEDNIQVNVALSDVTSVSTKTEEQTRLFPLLERVTQITYEELLKDICKQEDMLKKIGLQGCRWNIGSFIKSKSNLCADMRHKCTAVRETAACHLHDTLVNLERRQEELRYQKYGGLKQLKYFRRDMERMRELSMNAEREHDEGRLNWFPVLLARLPESVKSDHYVQKILKKLEKYGKSPDLKIHPDTFLKVLADLQVWELCSPEIAAAVEFVRESIVQMPEEDFSKWFQTRVAPPSVNSPPPFNLR